MKNFLMLLSGKKTTIFAIIGLILVFCVNRGYVAKDISELIAGIMVILGGTANYLTARMYQGK